MFEISINDMAFLIKGGHFESERKISQHLSIDVTLYIESMPFIEKPEIGHTIDYTVVFEIVRQEVNQGVVLLEGLASNVVKALRTRFDHIIEVEVAIRKKPALGGSIDDVEVRLVG